MKRKTVKSLELGSRKK